jgi:hypothetical protein
MSSDGALINEDAASSNKIGSRAQNKVRHLSVGIDMSMIAHGADHIRRLC